ncbi:short chain dehydrogenase [compost metagenome]
MSDTTLAVVKNIIPDYHVEEHVKILHSINGNQPGDPAKLAKILQEISRLPEPPLHLPLGTDSYQSILEHRKKESIERELWKHLSLATDF